MKNCFHCGESVPLKPQANNVKFCSVTCRNRNLWIVSGKDQAAKKRLMEATTITEVKKQCVLCGLWFIKVGSHVRMSHNMTARSYREQAVLPVRKGILHSSKREHLRAHALANKMDDQVKEAGKKYRFKKNDPRTKKNTFYKGKAKLIKKISSDIY